MSEFPSTTQVQGADVRAADPVGGFRELARGTAYVEAVVFDDDRSVLRLLYPGGHKALVSTSVVPAASDYGPAPVVRRVLAVQVRTCAAGVWCTVVGTSGTGPKRVPISMKQALALASSGVHTTVRSE